jgi:hypothetical protein
MTAAEAKAQSLMPADPHEVAKAVLKITDWIDQISRDGVTSYNVKLAAKLKLPVAETLRGKGYRVQMMRDGLSISWS